MAGLKLPIILLLIVFFVTLAVYLYLKARGQVFDEDFIHTYAELLEALKRHMVDLVSDHDDFRGTEEEYLKEKADRAKASEAFKNAVFAIPAAKIYTREVFKNFIAANVPPRIVDQILGLDGDSEPSPYVMFLIIMYHYEKYHKYDALSVWIADYDLARERQAAGVSSEGDTAYYITLEDLEYTYSDLSIDLDRDERIEVLAMMAFEDVKGYGKLGIIQEQNINGYNLGVSGSTLDYVDSGEDGRVSTASATNSLWLYIGEKYIHLEFLDFESQDEIRRCIQRLIRYNSPGSLTEKRGLLTNSLYDQSRVMAVRPPIGETWACFVRKCAISSVDPTVLIYKPYVKGGAEFTIKFIQFLMQGFITIAVSGRQGSGKTTMMKGFAGYYPPTANIRTVESVKELYLRELYPDRNIFGMTESEFVKSAQIEVGTKKMDSRVTTIGEIASDEVAGEAIQLGMTGSECLLFSIHSNTAAELVRTMRNALMKTAHFDNTMIAENQVTTVVRINIHLDYVTGGERFIRRITEIIKLAEDDDYPEYDEENPERAAFRLKREYYIRRTDRPTFITRDIIVYNMGRHCYEIKNPPSDELSERICEKLTVGKAEEYRAFIDLYWRGQKTPGYEGVTDVHRPGEKPEQENATVQTKQEESGIIDNPYRLEA